MALELRILELEQSTTVSRMSISNSQLPPETAPAIVATRAEVSDLLEAVKHNYPERCKLLKFALQANSNEVVFWHSEKPEERFTLSNNQFKRLRGQLMDM